MEQTNLLRLYKEFSTKKHPPIDKNVAFFKSIKEISVEMINSYIDQLNEIAKFFSLDNIIQDNVVVAVKCRKIMAKSNRINWLFKFNKKSANDYVVGSWFHGENYDKQTIVYSFSKNELSIAVQKLNQIKYIIQTHFGGSISKEELSLINKNKELFKDGFLNKEVAKSNFINTCENLSFIEEFYVEKDYAPFDGNALITLLIIPGQKPNEILKRLNINPIPVELPEDTFLLSKDDYDILCKRAPYLIVSQSEDFSKFDIENKDGSDIEGAYIGSPKSEPIIGVIDTLFAKGNSLFFKDAYFSEWVEAIEMLEGNRKPTDLDYIHGTEVDSLLVDLPNINPELDDGCGNFRVRHFGVASSNGVSVPYLIKKIEEIVTNPKNSDINVWNICLGSTYREIKRNSISIEGALLDRLQFENPNIVFVVSGTNKPIGAPESMMIGSPADSINSIVVNSCTLDGKPASYSRKGPALSFFIKPDVSTFGGDLDEKICVVGPWGKRYACGTSFAAPLISRKMAYLMGVLKMNRNVAKALLIDSVTPWKGNDSIDKSLIGRGVVKNHITSLLKGENDEIKFFIEGSSQLYSTYTYSLPVPVCDDNKYHYRAKATICYFPQCSRSQGVDYTNTELKLNIGRLKKDGSIDTIDNSRQYLEEGFTFEKEAREMFRKWDNIKTIIDMFPSRNVVGKDVLNENNKNWGISVSYSDRLDPEHKNTIPWGIVVTLKATDGKNRYVDFIHNCELNGWLVTQINYETSVEIQNVLNEEIDWNDE